MTHREAVVSTLAALGNSDVAAANIRLVFGLADVLDENPFSEPEIWREYRMALKALREALGGDSDVDEELAGLLARLGGTDVLDKKD
jgi:hypothetical protein